MSSATIESLDREGRGVARVEGKTVFIDGALPRERVRFLTLRSKRSYEFARAEAVERESPERVVPPCPYFGACGGCSLQHVGLRAQVAAKQRVLEDSLWHIGRVRAESMLPAIHGLAWGYRHRARLSARFVAGKGGALVGFRERHSTHVADMWSCKVLPEAVSALLPGMRRLVSALSIRERMPQVELALGDSATALVFRTLLAPDAADLALLKGFAEAHGVQVWLQPKGPDSAVPFFPEKPPALFYDLPEFDLRIHFLPTDFTQVNPAVNKLLVRRAMMLLDPGPGERIADFFCGLGNFALPIARLGAAVTGFEGNAPLLTRASANARANGLEPQCRFEAADLSDARACAALESFDKALLDPPREGAIELVKSFAGGGPRRLVYVSCDPATLGRDAGVLVNLIGYRLLAAGAVNMFPHTSHVESVALFEKQD